MMPLIKLLRPRQWVKNAFVLAPLFFAHRFLDVSSWELSLTAVLCFIGISSAVYVANDLHDVEEDRLHPKKCKRPLAAGSVSQLQALLLGLAMLAAAVFCMMRLPGGCALIAALYVWLNLLYTHLLKRIAILDIFFIASCYVLRVLMGCYALAVTVSPWIILTTFLLALFLGFSKRYHEMGYEAYAQSKPNLQHYNRNLLDRLITICGGATLLTYAIYTAEVGLELGKVQLVYTVGFVAFGLFRYLQAIYVYNQGGEPESVLLKDKIQLANVALWLITTMAIMF